MPASSIHPGTGNVSAQHLAYLDEHIQRYISSGRPAGALTVVYHKDWVAHWSAQGLRDRERGKPITDDTIFRIYSMTKPITSVALMQLYERGLVQLDDPVHRYIPSWERLRVYQSGSYPELQTTPCERPLTVHDLLTHQSGLTYGYAPVPGPQPGHYRGSIAVAAAYRRVRIGRTDDSTLQHMIDALSELPLEFSPGTAWNYSVSTDVVGYLVEVISGQRLDRYLQEQIFEPLGMTDTALPIRRSGSGRTRPSGSPPATVPRRTAPASRSSTTRPLASSCGSQRFTRAAAGSSRRPATTCDSAGCCSATVSLTARGSSGARPWS
jgi:CubicO group peptidase (beta-lactamase class C family)